MQTLGYYNGRIGEIADMMVPMADRASWFGDGVYDALACRHRHLFALEEHLDRFYRNAARVEIQVPMPREELKKLLQELVWKVDDDEVFAYWQVTRGSGPRAHVFPEGPANLWITLTPAKVKDGSVPVQLITLEDTRFFHCDIKTLNLMPSVMASEKAKRAGCEEAVLYRPGGRVTEGAHSNVHIIRGGTLVTAPTDNLILPGIARAHLIRACGRLGIPVLEEPFFLEDLFQAEEVLVTSSGRLCMRADTIDGKPVGCRRSDLYWPLHREIMDEYMRETE